LIELSSGEHKRLQLIKALWLQPQVLIIDQPYTGLDAQSRKDLNQIFDQLADKGVTLLLISNDDEQPDCINRFAEIQEGKIRIRQRSEELSKGLPRTRKALPYFLQQAPQVSAQVMVKMNKISISYGEKQVLKNIDWEVKAGEKWLLQGHNGSGKSTLLSLINGDHPQAYANDIHLFGKKRGSGESIWDIKEHLGIISPELHWYYDMNANVGQTIASGFFDSMSLYQRLGFEQQQKLEQILHFFDLKEVKHKAYLPKLMTYNKEQLLQLFNLTFEQNHIDKEQWELIITQTSRIADFGRTLSGFRPRADPVFQRRHR